MRPLRRLRSLYGNLSARSSSLKLELDVAQLATDLDPFNDDFWEDLQHLRVAYQQACWDDVSAAKQRAKVKWLSDGDANTRYFHQVVKEKRHTHHIHSICNSDGIYVYDDSVPCAFIDHFKSIIGTKHAPVSPSMPLTLFSNHLSLTDANYMIRPIQDEEIRKVLFSIGNNKAPGSDGFSSKFLRWLGMLWVTICY
jgi:hypothetical protein